MLRRFEWSGHDPRYLIRVPRQDSEKKYHLDFSVVQQLFDGETMLQSKGERFSRFFPFYA